MDVTLSAADARECLLVGDMPTGIKVSGRLDLSVETTDRIVQLSDDLEVDVLDLHGHQQPFELPLGLKAYEVILANSAIARLPEDLQVECRIDLTGCEYLESLPTGLTVGTLNLRGCSSIVRLPDDLDVWFLNLSGCWAFNEWPRRANIRSGQLALRGCTALTSLPDYLQRLGWLDVRDCPNLSSLPQGLEISGWLDIAHSGLLTEDCLPKSLDSVQLQWAGVAIDRRIAFHPETITVEEVLQERNAERRRVLLDRYSYPRFMSDANAEVLNADADPGGERQLLRIRMEGDEDLVTLSCHCPSTGRQYIIRVPPAMQTCHEAAAWIAGFDNPNDYRPLVET